MPLFPSNTTITSTLNEIKNNTPHLALYSAAPTAAGGGTELSGYTRQPITFGAITNGSMANSSAVTFTNLPTTTVTHYGIFDAATGGTFRAFGSLNTSAPVVTGDQLQFAASSITVSLAGS